MSIFSNPFDSNLRLRCECGQHASAAEHEASQSAQIELSGRSSEAHSSRVVEQAVMRAIFPQDEMRRKFLQVMGAPTALAAISSVFPLAFAKEAFAQSGKLEKTNLKVGFIPITCATPIIMADPMGFYKKQGLNVEVVKTAGWAVVRDKALNKEYDAAHMLSPMPLAISMGAGASPTPYTVPGH